MQTQTGQTHEQRRARAVASGRMVGASPKRWTKEWAYNKGYSAARRGATMDLNPFDNGHNHPLWDSWKEGFIDGATLPLVSRRGPNTDSQTAGCIS